MRVFCNVLVLAAISVFRECGMDHIQIARRRHYYHVGRDRRVVKSSPEQDLDGFWPRTLCTQNIGSPKYMWLILLKAPTVLSR